MLDRFIRDYSYSAIAIQLFRATFEPQTFHIVCVVFGDNFRSSIDHFDKCIDFISRMSLSNCGEWVTHIRLLWL